MTDNKQDDVLYLDLGEIIRVLWQNVLVIILVAVLFGTATLGATYMFVSPKYDATATLYVNVSSFSLGSTAFNISSGLSTDTLVDSYMLIIKSRTTLEEVIEEAGLNMSSTELEKMISTDGRGSTGALSVTVTASDPSQAELIANTIAKILPDRIANIIDGTSVRIIDYAIIPATRSSPDYIRTTVIGILAGALLSSFVFVCLYLFDQRNDVAIHSSDEIRKLYPDIPVLASIPDMRVAKKKGYYYSSYYGSDKGGK